MKKRLLALLAIIIIKSIPLYSLNNVKGVAEDSKNSLSKKNLNPLDIYNMALSYANAKNYTLALKYFVIVANTSPKKIDTRLISFAKKAAGEYNLLGLGTKQDTAKALKFFNAVISTPNPDKLTLAQIEYFLGGIYQDGKFIPIDKIKSNDYFKKAISTFNDIISDTNYANNKYTLSYIYYYLGEIYMNGYGVMQSTPTALEYFNKVTNDTPLEYAKAQKIINALRASAQSSNQAAVAV
jgi:TPR repeat protein